MAEKWVKGFDVMRGTDVYACSIPRTGMAPLYIEFNKGYGKNVWDIRVYVTPDKYMAAQTVSSSASGVKSYCRAFMV